MKMPMPSFQTTVLMLVTALLCFNVAVFYTGYRSIERQNELRTEYARLRSGILYTNLRIRDAALIADRSSLDDELAKINPVRKESLDALEFFRREQHTFPPEQRVITQRILIDRMEYRAVQNKLLALIRDVDFEEENPKQFAKERWKLLQQYNLLMVEYIDKCDALLSLSRVQSKRVHDKALATSLGATVVSVILMASVLAIGCRR